MQVSLTLISLNRKTGPMPVSMTSRDSCPPSCPLAGAGCYADYGKVALHWKRVTERQRGTDWHTFLARVSYLGRHTLWRHNVAGDLPGDGTTIDAEKLDGLVRANTGRRGFTYTHYPMNAANRKAVKRANKGGFTINLSANNLEHADRLAALKVGPVVTLLPYGTTAPLKTPKGRDVRVCPAALNAARNCTNCALCQRKDRAVIVGFPAHGPYRKATQVFQLYQPTTGE